MNAVIVPGCSDCPPAAANVAAISDRPDILALSFAVDYL
jgi:hypothetical protein